LDYQKCHQCQLSFKCVHFFVAFITLNTLPTTALNVGNDNNGRTKLARF
jgi:hypothetical protein